MLRAILLIGAILASTLCRAEDPFVEPKMKIRGVVLTSDGKPAAGARVIISDNGVNEAETTADAKGLFETEALANSRCFIFAATEDRSEQKWLQIPAHALRTWKEPFIVQMTPSTPLRCRFVDELGAPVEGASVSCHHHLRFSPPVKSDAKGEAAIYLATDWKHLGTGACGFKAGLGAFVADKKKLEKAIDDPSHPVVEFSLVAKKPHLVRVVDEAGKPVEGVSLGIYAMMKDGRSCRPSRVEEELQKTDAKGEYLVDWCPADLEYLGVDADRNEWKDNEITNGDEKSPTVLSVSRRVWMEGRLSGPPGVDLRGFCIAGHAHNATFSSDLANVRCDAAGRFRFRVAAKHTLMLSVQDEEYVSAPVVIETPSDEMATPQPISLALRKGAKLRIDVLGIAEGQDPMPRIELSQQGVFVDPVTRERRTVSGFSFKSAICNAEGKAEFHVFPGSYSILTRLDPWMDRKSFVVPESGATVEVHLPDFKPRKAQGRIVASDDVLKSLEGKLQIRSQPAKTPGSNTPPGNEEIAAANVEANGRFAVETVGDWANVIAQSDDGKWFATKVVNWSGGPVELQLQPAARYSGVVLDGDDKPMAEASVNIRWSDANELYAATVKTDAGGRFEFASLPTGVNLRLRIEGTVYSAERGFEPGEARTGVKLRTKPAASKARLPLDSVPGLEERVAELARDGRLATMGALVVLEGPEHATKEFVQNFVLDETVNPMVLEYLPRRFETTLFNKPEMRDWAIERLWPMPAAGQFALVVIDEEGKAVAHGVFSAKAGESQEPVIEFLRKHAPARRNALEELAAALAKAKKEGKRVIVKSSGPRCYPCLLLARWLDDHRELLNRDYIYLTFGSDRDEGGEELARQIGAERQGIPYFVIVDEEGNILITSEGLVGNIGMPGGTEAKRHFRKMLQATARRLTEKEIDGLMATLEDDE